MCRSTHLKSRPHWQQCRSNIVACYKVACRSNNVASTLLPVWTGHYVARTLRYSPSSVRSCRTRRKVRAPVTGSAVRRCVYPEHIIHHSEISSSLSFIASTELNRHRVRSREKKCWYGTSIGAALAVDNAASEQLTTQNGRQ